MKNDHTKHLTGRLSLWNKNDIDGLMSEGRILQSLLTKFSKSKSDAFANTSFIARRFSQLMMSGKVKDGLRLLSSECVGKVLPFDSLMLWIHLLENISRNVHFTTSNLSNEISIIMP